MAASAPVRTVRRTGPTEPDALTGLVRGAEFAASLDRAIQSEPGPPVLVLAIGLDRFRHINELLGYDVGDEALQVVAQRLKSWAPEGAIVGRLGGDQFAVALFERQAELSQGTAGQVLRLFDAPATLAGRDLFLPASIGISRYPESGTTAAELLRSATQALLHAKQRGGSVAQSAPAKPGLLPERRYELENALRYALDRGEFALRYQPQVDRGGRLAGLEVLLVWSQSETWSLDTEALIHLAEEIGTIATIGEWVLRTACDQWSQWQRQDLSPPRLAVNVSPLQFSCAGFVEKVRDILDHRGLQGHCLELEVTEGAILRDMAESAARMAELRTLGVRIAIDDFGIGYSPLAYLSQLPLDVVKVDRTFVGQITESFGTLPVVHTITVLAHQLGLQVVAEGVETEGQLELVHAARCDLVQGFLVSRPMTADQVTAILKSPGSLLQRLESHFPARV